MNSQASPLYVLTPTGGRSEAFSRLVCYMNRQVLKPDVWIIVDDCDPSVSLQGIDPGIDVQLVRPAWRWSQGKNTQAQCLAVGLEHVPPQARLVIMEDDDHYKPAHLVFVAESLDYAELVGETPARYYNVATRRWQVLPSDHHASLCSVGLRDSALTLFRSLCQQEQKHIDIRLWREFKGRKSLRDGNQVTGIKGLPGRGGIGIGHQSEFGKPDPSGHGLRCWIGQDADLYLTAEGAA